MVKSNKVKTRAVLNAGVTSLLFVLALYLIGRGRGWSVADCGIPEALSSIRNGEKCCRTLVANGGELQAVEA